MLHVDSIPASFSQTTTLAFRAPAASKPETWGCPSALPFILHNCIRRLWAETPEGREDEVRTPPEAAQVTASRGKNRLLVPMTPLLSPPSPASCPSGLWSGRKDRRKGNQWIPAASKLQESPFRFLTLNSEGFSGGSFVHACFMHSCFLCCLTPAFGKHQGGNKMGNSATCLVLVHFLRLPPAMSLSESHRNSVQFQICCQGLMTRWGGLKYSLAQTEKSEFYLTS